jgi:diacylglycerol kinase
MVWTAEIFNSAFERLVDMVSPDFNPKAGIIKDMAAGAVLVSAIVAVIVGVLIFWKYVEAWVRSW